MALVHVRQQGARRAAGQVGREPARELPDARSTAATTSPTSRSPATRDGEITGLRVKTLANLGGRLSTIGPGIPTTLYGRVLRGPLQDPERLLRGHRRLHEHDVRRRLPRRRPARGDLRRRAGDGPVRRRDRDGPRPRSGAGTSSRPTQFPYDNPSGLGTASAAPRSTSTRATTSRPWTRRSRWPATTTSTAKKAEAEGPRQATSASASRPTSRSAASRPRSGSARSARAGAPRCGSRPTSRST